MFTKTAEHKLKRISLFLSVFIFISCSGTNKKIPEMVLIKGGHFSMGSNINKQSDEYPANYVYVKNFYLSKYEITHQQYKYFLDDNPHWKKQNKKKLIAKKLVDMDYLDNWKDGKFPEKLKNHPVNFVSWFAAVAYCNWLSQETGKKVRLPDEAEWEYAAGNGEKHDPYGSMPMDKKDLTYGENPGPYKTTRPIGSHKPNDFGLYDMNGNVWELTMSTYDRYPFKPFKVNSMKSLKHNRRVIIRGGSFDTLFVYTTSTFRHFIHAFRTSAETGFRVAISAN